MSILYLAIGFGVGTLVTSLLTLWVIGKASKPSMDAKEQAKRTVDLLAERNEIDAKIERHLQAIAGWANRHL